ncbi:MAG TPA: heavy metal translocating P-type ATPase [Candidatus Saccharibacteria bacterium]|nr:heavy metal translocating P-type ATPase [Candidatus Saccharibacteria bacterium]HMT39397.1 heavy metal translocating P-type ATPase [Candidatus Saccharibacteria bacterium]
MGKNFIKFVSRYGWLIFVLVGLFVARVFYLVGNIQYSHWLIIVICVVGIIPEIKDILYDILHKKFGVDIIAVIAVLASLALEQYAAAGIILLMFTSGAALEQYAKSRALKELDSLLKRAPKLAHAKRGSEFIDIDIDKVVVNDILLIKPGEIVPVDAVVISGDSYFDESAITGESMPVEKNKKDLLLSGTINKDSAIQAKALRTSAQSQYEQIIDLVRAASSSKSPMIRLADAYSIPFTIIAFSLSSIAWIVSGDPVNALAVLVVATPCPLLIATPVAIVSGISRSARDGIIVKDGASLETLSRVNVLAFDKTGTLTINRPTITGIKPHGVSERFFLQYMASAEQKSSHLLANTIVEYAKSKKIKLLSFTNVSEQVGGGISAKYKQHNIYIGKLSFLKDKGVQVPPKENESRSTAVYLGIDKKFMGNIEFSDPLRKNANTTLKRIHDLTVDKIIMLTGDKKVVANQIAEQVGISDVHAGLLPIEKLHVIQSHRQQKEIVAMVGDGVNDAPTLAAADVGIALGAKGSTAASESADVVIMLDNISKVADSMSIAKRSVRIAKQSIFVGIGLSIVLMILASLGKIPPVYGALLQELVDVAVIVNALRALNGGLLKSNNY